MREPTVLRLAGLRGRATIRRDGLGIPHVEAGTELDAWLAMGFACAQDRLWQMEWYRLRGEGRWAAVAGPVGVEEDLLFRRLALPQAARADAAAMAPATAAMFEAYARGVNAFLASQAPLPPEFRLTQTRPRPWEPWHSVLVFKVRHAVMGKIALKLARTELLRRVGPETYARLAGEAPPMEPVILPPGCRITPPAGCAGSDGSNSWAVHGSRTSTGAAVLCNDSHRPLDAPNVYWQCAVSWPGAEAAGATFPGFPAFPHFGFNGRVGWNITHAMADTQDLYAETFDPQRPSRYLTESGWREASITSESIEVRACPPVAVTIVRTRHGTVIDGEPGSGRAVALRTTTTDRPSRQWDCLRPMLSAGSVAELFETQRGWEDPVNNLVAADAGGSIGYLTRGRLPVRPTRDARQLVVAGASGEHEWAADVPFDEMPRSIDPPEGFVATANQRVTCGPGPYVAHEFAPPGRAERIRELVLEAGRASPERIASFQADTVSVRARGWARLLAASTAMEGDSELARTALAAWDGDLGAGSGAALLYACFRQELARAVFAPQVGPQTWTWMVSGTNPGAESLLERWLYDLGAQQAPATAVVEALPEALAAAWQRAAAAAGSADPRAWRWDAVHRCASAHPLSAAIPQAAGSLDPPAFGLGGDNDTIRVASYSLAKAGEFSVKDVSVYRQVIDFATRRMLWSIPGGASGVPGSSHSADQLEAWRQCRLTPAALSVEDASRAAVSTLILEVP